MKQIKGGSPIKVALAFLILGLLFAVSAYGIHVMSSGVDDYTDENTDYFEDQTEESSLEKEESSEDKLELLKAHYGSSNVAFTL